MMLFDLDREKNILEKETKMPPFPSNTLFLLLNVAFFLVKGKTFSK